jgi:hypothetical protein
VDLRHESMRMDTSRVLSGSEMSDGQHFTIVEVVYHGPVSIVVTKYSIIPILSAPSMGMPGAKMLDGSLSQDPGSKMEKVSMLQESTITQLRAVSRDLVIVRLWDGYHSLRMRGLQ